MLALAPLLVLLNLHAHEMQGIVPKLSATPGALHRRGRPIALVRELAGNSGTDARWRASAHERSASSS